MESQANNCAEACAKCGGKCCKNGGIFVTKYEYGYLPDDDRKKQISPFKSAYLIDAKPCPYLDVDKCSLGDERFIDCKMYPWTHIGGFGSGSKVKLSDQCPGRETFNTARMEFNADTLLVRSWIKEKITSQELLDYDSINYKIDKDK